MTGPHAPLSLLIDNDTGIDDALALAYLAACDHVDIVAVTATPGNVDADQVAANNRALLRLCGREDVPVRIGARAPLVADLVTTPETHGPQGVGYAELPAAAFPGGPGSVVGDDAVAHWVEAARARPGELTALLTAPLTNFALALRAEPRLPWLLKSVVIMGGAFYYPGNTTPTAEWNTHVDPHAFKEVFAAYEEAAQAGLPDEQLPILCSLEATERYELRPDLVGRLASSSGAEPERVHEDDAAGARSTSSNPLIRYLSDALRFYFEFHRAYDQGFIAHVHDYFAAGVAAGTLEYRTRAATVDVETEAPLLYGTTVADFRGLWQRPANARVVTWNDPEAGFAELVERVGHFARRYRNG
ncbi:nucleoside hydrolase [Zhihengliuella flava]|uniref:Inosine-uridine nucleoside N-ribohydrolase n=1 Tax=Zhihengliuella flava TaxID=1285193 RepID=A0A931GGE2_9MICC|nr:nucleoside hydrolase [Zhihengliuella flava]MBG6085697.1 inosine-uridine nucleoside N-ribohydrolase [Zhihengliuella flava]